MKKNDNSENENAWTKPVLTILVRNNPEETVLAGCKGTGLTGTPRSDYAGCTIRVVTDCGDCANLGNS